MDSLIPTTISGALDQRELEEILIAATEGLNGSCLSFIRYSIVVFGMAPGQEPRVLKTVPIVTGPRSGRRCVAVARCAARKIGQAANVDWAERDMRIIEIERNNMSSAAQTQIVFHNLAMGSLFAILLPDIAWSRYFPTIAGPLVAVVANKLSLPEDKPRTLRMLCCRKFVAQQMLEDEKKWRAAAAEAMHDGSIAGGRFDIHTDALQCPHGEGIFCGRVLGWHAFPVALTDIHGAHWKEFTDKYYVDKNDEDIDPPDDEYKDAFPLYVRSSAIEDGAL